MVTYEIDLRICLIVTPTQDQYDQNCQTSPVRVFLVRVNLAVDLAKESWPLNVTMILVGLRLRLIRA